MPDDLDRNTSQLMYMPERVFPALKADPPVVEALLLPFSLKGKTNRHDLGGGPR